MALNNAVDNTLTSPKIITSILDSNGNVITTLTPAASAVNNISILNNATGFGPGLVAVGSDTNIPLNLLGKGTGGVPIHGTGTNDSAAAGYVGEVIESNVPIGSAISISAGVAANITSITLTAGDWDIWGGVTLLPAGSTVSRAIFWSYRVYKRDISSRAKWWCIYAIKCKFWNGSCASFSSGYFTCNTLNLRYLLFTC